MPQFEVYQRADSYAGRRRQGETVTVQRRGLMSLSPAAFTRLGSPEAVKFLIARGERVIGFQPCGPQDEDAHAVRGRAHAISGVTVLKYLGAGPGGSSRRYTLQVKDGLPPYIDLNEDAPVVTSNRRKAGRDGRDQ